MRHFEWQNDHTWICDRNIRLLHCKERLPSMCSPLSQSVLPFSPRPFAAACVHIFAGDVNIPRSSSIRPNPYLSIYFNNRMQHNTHLSIIASIPLTHGRQLRLWIAHQQFIAGDLLEKLTVPAIGGFSRTLTSDSCPLVGQSPNEINFTTQTSC